MTKGLRWRVLVLQTGLIGILAFCAGFLFWAADFSHTQVHDQLAAQQIYFPAADSKGMTAAEFPSLQQYGGQQMLNGVQAQAYANDFIGVHLKNVANGQTYAQVSALAQANPKDAKLAGQVATLFKGETLRGLLLNAYGWWQVGTYALYAGIGLAIASFAVLLAMVFELRRWRVAVRKPATSTSGSLRAPQPA